MSMSRRQQVVQWDLGAYKDGSKRKMQEHWWKEVDTDMGIDDEIFYIYE